MGADKKFFPLFLNVEGKNVTVFGAGKIAARRVETFLKFGAEVKVVAPIVSEKIRKLEEEGKIIVETRKYRINELTDQDFVIAATDDNQVNLTISRECRHKEIMVNVTSKKEQCDFYFPGIVEEAGMIIGITASGNDHGKVKDTRERIENLLREV